MSVRLLVGDGTRPEARKRRRSPSLLALFNWAGLGCLGGYFVVLPVHDAIPDLWQAWATSAVALVLLLGHCYLWDLRRRKRGRR